MPGWCPASPLFMDGCTSLLAEYGMVLVPPKKLDRFAKTTSIIVPHFHYNKHSSGRQKWCYRRAVSEAALRFGNLYVNKPSVLHKKCSASLEETFRFSQEALQIAMQTWKNVLNDGIILFDAYHRLKNVSVLIGSYFQPVHPNFQPSHTENEGSILIVTNSGILGGSGIRRVFLGKFIM